MFPDHDLDGIEVGHRNVLSLRFHCLILGAGLARYSLANLVLEML